MVEEFQIYNGLFLWNTRRGRGKWVGRVRRVRRVRRGRRVRRARRVRRVRRARRVRRVRRRGELGELGADAYRARNRRGPPVNFLACWTLRSARRARRVRSLRPYAVVANATRREPGRKCLPRQKLSRDPLGAGFCGAPRSFGPYPGGQALPPLGSGHRVGAVAIHHRVGSIAILLNRYGLSAGHLSPVRGQHVLSRICYSALSCSDRAQVCQIQEDSRAIGKIKVAFWLLGEPLFFCRHSVLVFLRCYATGRHAV
jgi:hypothetical protein